MPAWHVIFAGRSLLKAAAGLVWSPACIACSSNEPTHGGFCECCGRELLLLAGANYCQCCGASLGPHATQGQETCPSCPKQAFKYERLVRLGAYAGPLKQAIRRFKYHPAAGGWQALADMLAEAVRARYGQARLDVIVPVPMYWTRRLARGKNQSALLAGALGRRLKLPVGNELVRIRNTPPQVHLPASRRAQNVRGAFAVRGGAALAGAHVLLVDDVSTTGATANESAGTLLSAGAARVSLAVLAKADPPKAYSHELLTGQA